MHFAVELWDSLIFLSMYDCVYAYHVLLSVEGEARAIYTNFLLLLINCVTLHRGMHLFFLVVLLFYLLLGLSLLNLHIMVVKYSSCILAIPLLSRL